MSWRSPKSFLLHFSSPFSTVCVSQSVMFRSNHGGDKDHEPALAEDNHEKKQNHQQALAHNNELLAAFYWHNNITTGSSANDKGKGKVAVQAADPGRGRKLKRNSSCGPSVSWDYNHNNKNILKPNHEYDDDDDAEDLYKKKILHRDTERQRRQDMSGLYSKLQTLLPREYVEGKRSMSDHISGSVNYIDHLKRSITDLQDKRNWFIKSSSEQETGWSTNDFELVIQPSGVGYEVHIRVPLKLQGFSISRALGVLLEEGLDILNCSSTRLNEQFFHTIQCLVREENTSIDINGPRLQQRIYDACSSS